MFKKIMPAVLAVLLIGSFAGCQSKTGTTSSSLSSTISSAASGAKEEASNSSAEASKNGDTAQSAAASRLGMFRDALRDVYGDKYYPDTEMTEEQIREELGLDESLYEEVYAEHTAENERPDTFIAVKAKSGKVDEVKEKLTAYKQRLIDENSFDANADKLNAAEVYSEGDYVFFVLLGDVDDGTSSEGFAEALGKEVQRGIDAIKAALGAL